VEGNCIANQSRLQILAEGAGYAVIDKPAPLKVHPNGPEPVATMYDELCQTFIYELANGGQISIVNRLDRETSGVTLVALTKERAREFGLAMMEQRFHKTYLAICFGWPDWESYVHTGPILRRGEVQASEIYVKQMVHPLGVSCETRFQVLRRYQHSSGLSLALIKAQPVTGRMHQIRVHLSDLGHPLLGDKLYGPDERCYLDFMQMGWTAALQKKLLLPRQALHAAKLDLESFGCWTSPLPSELRRFLWSSADQDLIKMH
jgi:23S rRNA pseudouridine1911/1915/1917 synthase